MPRPRAPYSGMGARYAPLPRPPISPGQRPGPFAFSTPGAMGSNYNPPHPFGPGIPGQHPNAGQAYSMQAYLRSLGYPDVNAYLHALGLDAPAYTPMSDTDIQAKAKAYADSIINPQLDRLNQDYAGRTKLGAQAIQGLTGMLAGLAAQYGPAQGAAYSEAISSDKALAGDLADRLTASGQSGGAELGGKLAQAGQDTSGAGQIADVGRFAGNAGFAKDTAALEALVAHSAAAQEFGAKLPFIEGLTGAQAGGEYQAALAQSLGLDTRAITDQLPGLLQGRASDLYARDQAAQGRYDTARSNRAQAQINLTQDYVGARNRRQDLAHQAAVEAYNKQQNARTQAENQRRYNAGQAQAAQTLAYNKRQQRAANFQTLRDKAEARTGNQYIITSTGVRPRLVNGKPVPTAASSAQTRSEAERKREFNVSARAAGIKTQVQAETTAAKLAQAAQKEAHRHAETVAKINAQITAADERIRHNKATEQNSAASMELGRAATRARVADEKRREALTRAANAEHQRHAKVTERHAKASAAEATRHHKTTEAETRRHHRVTEKKQSTAKTKYPWQTPPKKPAAVK